MRRPTVAIAIAIAIAAGLFVRTQTRDDERSFTRAGSTLESSGTPMNFVDPPSSYTVEYERQTLAGSEHSITRETLSVLRPFVSIVDAKNADGAPAFTRRSGFAAYENESPSGGRAVLTAPPALAASDLRPEVALPAALDAGLVELGDRRRVLDRECQMYRAGAPLSSGDVAPYDSSASEWAESCFDRSGLLLEELWWLDGAPIERLIALSVSFRTPDAAQSVIKGRPIGSIDDGNGDVRQVAVASRLPAPIFHELRGVPERFEHRGRYSVVWPAGSAVRGSSDRVGTLTDVWVDGIDIIVFERGGTLHGSAVLDYPASPTTVEAGGAGSGVLVLGMRGNEVRTVPRKGEFVRIVATLTPSDLLELASSIQAVEGGSLVEL